MDMAGGVQPLPYGHSTEVAVDIEGLAVCYLRISLCFETGSRHGIIVTRGSFFQVTRRGRCGS